MNYSTLVQKLDGLFQENHISGICCDSRFIKPNEVFFALKGEVFDGNDYVSEVLANNAALVITDNPKILDANNKKIIYVPQVQKALRVATDFFYPQEPIMTAVTGTNGKSSVVSYIAQLYSLLGENSAAIGTLGVEVFSNTPITIEKINDLTTPDYLSFKKTAHNLAKNGIKYLAFEASSHGLQQKRLSGIKVQHSCFTSFSQDHLDYHLTHEAYLLAKLQLFTDNLLSNTIAVLNSDIAEIEFIKAYLNKHNVKFITVGTQGDLRIIETTSSITGQDISFIFNDQIFKFHTPIIGSYQASNLLISLLAVDNVNLQAIINLLPQVKQVKGRMERVTKLNNKFHIFVDYAHTPDALKKTLQELRNITPPTGKLKVVFGCGGNRDKIKRSLMGKIATMLADEVIITDDNPRNENPSAIRQEIISGITLCSDKYVEIGSRSEAINYAVNSLKVNDILLIAGKGHENYQIIGEKKIPFNDAEIVRNLL